VLLFLILEYRGFSDSCLKKSFNFCRAGVLTLWFIFAPLGLPLRGYIVLWAIAIVVFAIGFVELIGKFCKEK
jgi:hypothetical protein